jgi:hypothetical protein
MAERKARADEMEAKARKANAEADRAEIEAQILKQKLASAHMGELRAIEAHDHQIEDVVQARQHRQDAHGVDMVTQGINAAAAAAPPAPEGAPSADQAG